MKNPLKLFSIWKSKSLIADITYTKTYLNYFDKENGDVYFFPSFAWFLDANIKSSIFNLSIKKFYNIITCNKYLENKSINFHVNLKHSVIPNFQDSIYDQSRYIMMNEYIKIIKSIAKKIRRKHCKENLSNFYKKQNAYLYYDYFKDKLSDEGLCYKDISEDLYAYIMWRKEVEGHEYINSIHTKMINRASDDPQFMIKRNITDTLFYKYLISEFDLYFDSYSNNEFINIDDYGVLVSAFEHILSIILIRYYNDWLAYSRKIKRLHPNNIINFNAAISPPLIDFVVKYNKNDCEAQINYYNIRQ